jgi:acetylornithine deacetylase/succinyl-diaminopimelate desuccinylase-like protein
MQNDGKSYPNWEKVAVEATDILSKYIKIKTVNPPGEEEKAAEFLKGLLDKEGISSDILKSAPGRANIISRLKGQDPRGLILLSHIDVVPVEEDKWERDPFGGEVVDGQIWGRGAIDNKGMGVMNLMAMMLIKRGGIKLKRDVLFLATGDEETGGKYGAGYMVSQHKDKLTGKYLLNEGGAMVTDILPEKRVLVTIGVGEKGPLWLKLKGSGTPGHGSVPIPDNVIFRLSKALQKLEIAKRPIRFNDVMVDFAVGLGGGMGTTKGTILKLAKVPLLRGIIANMMSKNPSICAMLTDTMSVTTFNSGVKENVIPDRAEATLDNRLLPGTDKTEYIEWIKMTIDDDSIEVIELFHSEPSESPVDTDFFGAISDVACEMHPDGVIVPMVSSSFTDSRFFRDIGIISYGLVPGGMTSEELSTIHGQNERIRIESFLNGVKFVYKLILRLCA